MLTTCTVSYCCFGCCRELTELSESQQESALHIYLGCTVLYSVDYLLYRTKLTTCAVLYCCSHDPCREFSELSESQQESLLMNKSNLVFSRAEPKHKQVSYKCLLRCFLPDWFKLDDMTRDESCIMKVGLSSRGVQGA